MKHNVSHLNIRVTVQGFAGTVREFDALQGRSCAFVCFDSAEAQDGWYPTEELSPCSH